MSRTDVLEALRTSVLGQMWASLRSYWRQAAPYLAGAIVVAFAYLVALVGLSRRRVQASSREVVRV
jgi:hypothetical protein